MFSIAPFRRQKKQRKKRAPAGRRRSQSGFCLGRLASQVTRIEITVKTSTLFPKICQVLFFVRKSRPRWNSPLAIENEQFEGPPPPSNFFSCAVALVGA